ncbi:MAG TPA: Do family serine endopeptidase [Vicinamibacterales bacterium]|nr:Do family serine endopeptidase [Vicinamibacterales bacterium]
MSWFASSSRKTTLFYVALIAVASLVVGMVIASRLDLTPQSSAQTIAIPATNSAPLVGALDASTFRNIAKSQSPMVVSIRTEMRQKTQDLSEFFGGGNGDDLLNRFFGGGGAVPGQPGAQGRQRQPRERTTEAAGSGFIINREGYILTNNHVVEGATKIEVQFFDEEDNYYPAKVIGRDPLTDSALIQLTEKPSRPLPEAKFGDSSQMEPGDWVMAIGNPFNLAHTVSVGVISATARPFPVSESDGGRRYADVLQTDAAINPGNSGGPLLNARGEVIGMNTAIYSNTSMSGQAGNIGIGFAIPINTLRDVLPGLRLGKITRGRIGVSVVPVTAEAAEALNLKDRKGALVAQVPKSGPAATAGVEPGDVILQFNGKNVGKSDDLPQMVGSTTPGTTVPLKIVRNGKEMTLNVKVEELDLEAETGTQQSRNAEPGADTSAGFGITLNNITPDIERQMELPRGSRGAVVTDVDPDSPAARALQPGDVILQISGQPVSSATEASQLLRAVPAGRNVGMRIARRGQELFVYVKKQ